MESERGEHDESGLDALTEEAAEGELPIGVEGADHDQTADGPIGIASGDVEGEFDLFGMQLKGA